MNSQVIIDTNWRLSCLSRRRLVSGLAAGAGVALLAACQPTPPPTPTAPPPTAAPPTTAAANVGSAPATKPMNGALKITSPKADATVPVGDVKVSVDYTGPALVPAPQGKKLEDYHLHYFLDEDATPFIGTTTPIPRDNPKIAHAAATDYTFKAVTAGAHTVSVVLGGLNHISVSPPLADKVTFTVK